MIERERIELSAEMLTPENLIDDVQLRHIKEDWVEIVRELYEIENTSDGFRYYSAARNPSYFVFNDED